MGITISSLVKVKQQYNKTSIPIWTEVLLYLFHYYKIFFAVNNKNFREFDLILILKYHDKALCASCIDKNHP